jgi:hypothetical protein
MLRFINFSCRERVNLDTRFLVLNPSLFLQAIQVDRRIYTTSAINKTYGYSYFNYQLNAQFLYSITHVLLYNSRHVSTNTMFILRRSKLYFYSIWYRHSAVQCTGALYGRLQRVKIPDAVTIQFRPPEDEHSIARNMSRIVK